MPSSKKQKGIMPENVIFALDVGTRTIIGLVGVLKDERFVILASEVLEHSTRAMLDGQIHDISKVALEVSKVKERLENKVGFTLDKVSIAAAGRVLKTCQVRVDKEIEEGREIDSQMVSAIEMECIRKAQLELESTLQKKERDQFYCVGYSVVNYYLNDYVIQSLTGHKGHRAGAEILATFLPQMVVDGIYTVMEKTGLEVTHLTLEPIAALNVAIPKDLRLLNLALVDIGAGTSDIAITKAGTVIAYAMVPIAGDELTEAIAQAYLVDFNTAERIKLTLSTDAQEIEFTDILDNKVKVKPGQVIEVMKPVIDQLAKTITEKILEYNGGKPPNAIFLVGGGSQSKGLDEAVSDYIGLPRERVAVRRRSIAKNVVMEEDILTGPESITPLGILVTTGLAMDQDFFYVTVNGERFKMFNARKMSVSEVLAVAKFGADQLICKSGRSIKFFLNGKGRTVRGGMGKPAEILINDKAASLSSFISPGDRITVIPAAKGKDASIKCGELLAEFKPVTVDADGKVHKVFHRILLNGNKVNEKTIIKDGDHVDISMDCSISDIAKRLGIDSDRYAFLIDDEEKQPSFRLQGGEAIRCTIKPSPEQMNQGTQKSGAADNSILDFNAVINALNQVGSAHDGFIVKVNGKEVLLPPKATQYLFIDLFNHIDFDLTDPKGILKLKLNGADANYTDAIKPGDVIDIYWKE